MFAYIVLKLVKMCFKLFHYFNFFCFVLFTDAVCTTSLLSVTLPVIRFTMSLAQRTSVCAIVKVTEGCREGRCQQ